MIGLLLNDVCLQMLFSFNSISANKQFMCTLNFFFFLIFELNSHVFIQQ